MTPRAILASKANSHNMISVRKHLPFQQRIILHSQNPTIFVNHHQTYKTAICSPDDETQPTTVAGPNATVSSRGSVTASATVRVVRQSR